MYKNIKIILISIMLISTLSANSDIDLDGVFDLEDKCPNTKFIEIVGVDGCTIETVTMGKLSKHNFSVTTNLSYLDNSNSDTTVENILLSYNHKNISLFASLSTYQYSSDTTEMSGMLDTYLGVSYKLKPLDSLTISLSTGILLPTYNENTNNEIDYSFGIYSSYRFSKFNLYGSYNYTIIGDTDTDTLKHEDNKRYMFGIGYFVKNNLYINTSYTNSNSLYNVNNINIETVSFSTYYYFSNSLFVKAKYGKGVSDSSVDNSYSIGLGLNF